MNLLWIAVLIQTLFFIVQNEHFYVLMFIGFSLCINAFSKKEWFYLGIPFLIVFIIYFFAKHNNIEGFKIKIRKPSPRKVNIPNVKPPKAPSPPKVSASNVRTVTSSVSKARPTTTSVTKARPTTTSALKINPFAKQRKKLNNIVEKAKENEMQAYSEGIGSSAIMDAHNDSVNMMAQQQNALDQIMKNQLFLAEQLSG